MSAPPVALVGWAVILPGEMHQQPEHDGSNQEDHDGPERKGPLLRLLAVEPFFPCTSPGFLFADSVLKLCHRFVAVLDGHAARTSRRRGRRSGPLLAASNFAWLAGSSAA